MFFSPKYIKDKPFYKTTIYKARLLVSIEELSLIGHNNKNFDHDEYEDENDEEWVASYEERNASNLLDEA